MMAIHQSMMGIVLEKNKNKFEFTTVVSNNHNELENDYQEKVLV